jgi:hypothetical protein
MFRIGGKNENDRPARSSSGDGSEPGTGVHHTRSGMAAPLENMDMNRKLDSAAMAVAFCDRLSRLRPDTPREWGKMTPHQMVVHLVDSFRAVSGEKPVSSIVNWYGRTVMRWGALHTPIPWPRSIPTRPEMAAELGGTPPAEWKADYAELHARMLAFPTRTDFTQHPMMGKLSLDEWRTWAFRHIDHHFRQFGI